MGAALGLVLEEQAGTVAAWKWREGSPGAGSPAQPGGRQCGTSLESQGPLGPGQGMGRGQWGSGAKWAGKSWGSLTASNKACGGSVGRGNWEKSLRW